MSSKLSAFYGKPMGAKRWPRSVASNNIAEGTFYRWKKQYGGMEVAEAKRLKGLEKENAELKKMLAEAMLDNRVLKEINSKK